MTEHWVSLAKTFYTLLDILNGYAHSLSHFFLSLQIVWYELMERRVKQTNVNRTAVHCLEDAVEVSLLVRKQLSKSLLASFSILSKNHFAHCNNLLCLEEHVLCTAKTDTYSTEVACNLCIVWCISVCTNNELCIFLAKSHQVGEVARNLSCLCLNLSFVNLTCCTVD